uniref:Uncharacterized protein n=1 Tax=Zooxanthella nutricula TaxID=1333877 RepID=A0A7S2QFL1_9DINO
MLLAFVALQQSTFVAFNEGNNLNTFLHYRDWGVPRADEMPFDHCMMASRMMPSGDPLLIFVMGFTACVLVGLSAKQDAEQYLSAVYPRREHGFALWCLTRAVWLAQSIFLPGMFCIQATMLLAMSTDTMSILLNTLAVTFLLEMDDAFYEGFLTSRDREEYQALVKSAVALRSGGSGVHRFTFQLGRNHFAGECMATKDVRAAADRIYLLDALVMFVLFVSLRWRQPGGFVGYMRVFYPTTMCATFSIFFGTAFIQLWHWRASSADLSWSDMFGVALHAALAIFLALCALHVPLIFLLAGYSPLHTDYSVLLTSCLHLPDSSVLALKAVWHGV